MRFLKLASIFLCFILMELRDQGSLEILGKFKGVSFSKYWSSNFSPAFSFPFWLNPNVKDKLGYSLILYAIGKGDLNTLRYLLSKGADPNSQNILGQTPLHLAAMYGQTESVKILVSFGGKLDTQDIYKKSPIFYAVERGAMDSVKIFTDLGADLSLKEENGQSLLDEIERRNYRKMMLFLLGFIGVPDNTQKARIINYLDHTKDDNLSILGVKSGSIDYLLASIGGYPLFWEEGDTFSNLFLKKTYRNPKTIFRWLF